MDQQTFNGCLQQVRIPILLMLISRIAGCGKLIDDPVRVAEDLYGLTIVKCMALDYEGMDEERLRRVCFKMAKEAWIKYWHKITRRKEIMDRITYLHKRIETASHDDALESKDLWLFLRKYMTEEEEFLFKERVLNETSYEELSAYLNKKPATLRKQFERTRKKLYIKMLEEAIMQPSR